MSKKQKGKKEDLSGFNLDKEEEILKKIAQKNEVEIEQEPIQATGARPQNLFSADVFQKAQNATAESKKAKKKKMKAEQEVPKGKANKEDEEEDEEDDDDDEEEEAKEGATPEDEQELLKKKEKERLAREHEKRAAMSGPAKKSERLKVQRGFQATEKAPNAAKTAREEEKARKAAKKAAGEDDDVLIKERPTKLWNVCLTLFLLLLTGLLLFSKFQQEKFQKMARYNRGDTPQEDLYELLEVDSSVNPQELKKQYKKLAITWHPDKNPGCGQPCNEKFEKVHKAYEILSDPEKRKNYDENSGVFSPIKSKTVSLTMNNYRRLVEESNDIWIIQVYEDGHPMCISIADTWDAVAKSYNGVIKFGRVNAVNQNDLLNSLPYKITLFPTILAVVPGQYPDIFTWSRYNLELSLKRFIDQNIINFIHDIKEKDYQEKFGNQAQERFASSPRKSDVIYLTTADKTPIFYKYAAFQLHEIYDFYQTPFGEATKIRKSVEKAKLDYIVNVDQLKDENRQERYERNSFYFQKAEGSGSISNYLTQVLEFVKFNTLTVLDKHLYAEFCGGTGMGNDGDEYQFEDELKPSICILLLKGSHDETLQKNIYEIQKYQKVQSQKLYHNIINGESLFENYQHIRFGIIDVNRQPKFKRIVEEFSAKNEHSFPTVMAFIHENGKYFNWDGSSDLIDFIERINHGDDTLDAQYGSEILNSRLLNEFLFSKNENIFTSFYKGLRETLGDYKILLALVVIISMNSFLLKKTFGAAVVNGFVLYFLLSVVLSIFGTYQEMF